MAEREPTDAGRPVKLRRQLTSFLIKVLNNRPELANKRLDNAGIAAALFISSPGAIRQLDKLREIAVTFSFVADRNLTPDSSKTEQFIIYTA